MYSLRCIESTVTKQYVSLLAKHNVSSQEKHFVETGGMENRIQELRKQRGWTQAFLAEKLGTTAQQVGHLESGRRQLRPYWLNRFAAAFGIHPSEVLYDNVPPDVLSLQPVEVIGEVAAGMFRESLEWDEDERFFISLPPDPRYPGIRTFGVRVSGPSMNELFPEGSILNCIQLYDVDREPHHGERVIVRRRNDHDGWEFTCKELRIEKDGSHWLWPRSNHPTFQSPWRLASAADDNAGADELQIIALVIGSYRPE